VAAFLRRFMPTASISTAGKDAVGPVEVRFYLFYVYYSLVIQ
jgi:hypothetical protein